MLVNTSLTKSLDFWNRSDLAPGLVGAAERHGNDEGLSHRRTG